MNIENYEFEEDPDLPDAPKLEFYKETFGNLINVTQEYYKEDRY